MQDFVNKLPDFFKPWGENILLNPFNFSGRTSRRDFWMTVLVNFIIGLFAVIPVIGFIVGIINFVLGICCISMMVRRLNDIGKPWPFIFFYFVPCVGAFIMIYFFCQPSVD